MFWYNFYFKYNIVNKDTLIVNNSFVNISSLRNTPLLESKIRSLYKIYYFYTRSWTLKTSKTPSKLYANATDIPMGINNNAKEPG